MKVQSIILCDSKFVAGVSLKEHLLCQLIVVQIINIHKSRAMILFLRKHRILIRGGFIRYNVTARDVLSTI